MWWSERTWLKFSGILYVTSGAALNTKASVFLSNARPVGGSPLISLLKVPCKW